MSNQKLKKGNFRSLTGALCCIASGVIWLVPYRFSRETGFAVVGFLASVLIAELVQQPVVAGVTVVVLSAALSYFDVRYASCFAPFACSYLLLRYVCRENNVKSVKYDGFFFVGRIVAVAFAFIGFALGLSRFYRQPDLPLEFHREYVFLFLFILLYLYYILCPLKASGKKRGVETDEKTKKLRRVYIIAVFCYPAVFTFISACDEYVRLSTLPAFFVSVAPLFFIGSAEERSSCKKNK